MVKARGGSISQIYFIFLLQLDYFYGYMVRVNTFYALFCHLSSHIGFGFSSVVKCTYWKTSAFNQYEITVTRFTFPLETNKEWTKCIWNHSRHWTSINKGQWPLREGSEMRWALWLPKLVCLGRASCPWCKEPPPWEEVLQGETGRTPGIEEIEVRVWLDKNNAEIELLRERILEICRGSQLIIHLSANWHMHVRKLSRSN